MEPPFTRECLWEAEGGSKHRGKTHKDKGPEEYDLVGPKGKWKMGAGSEVLGDDVVIADVMGERFENKWLMQLSLFPKKANEATGAAESTFEEVEEWIPPPPEEARNSEDEEQERKELEEAREKEKLEAEAEAAAAAAAKAARDGGVAG